MNENQPSMSPNTVAQTIIKQNHDLLEANKRLSDQVKEILETISTLKVEIENLSANSSLGVHDEVDIKNESKTNSNASLPQQNDITTGDKKEEHDIKNESHTNSNTSLSQQNDITTVEENEEQLFNCRAKLFTFDSNTKELKERGLGNIQLLRHKTSKKLRLEMRREQTRKLCLNHAVTSDLEVVPHQHKKTWLFWPAADYSNGKMEYHLFACHFKTPENVSDFKNALEGALHGSAEDIEILYENLVSNDDREFAKKFQLPENFLAYKQKEDCPGCRGCPDEEFFRDHEKLYKSDSKTEQSVCKSDYADEFICKHAEMYVFDSKTKKWNKDGVGEIKVVLDAERGGYKLFLQHEKNLQTVLDYTLTPDIKLEPHPTSNRVLMWTAQKSNSAEQLALRFESTEIAKQFKQVVDVIQECLREVHNEESDSN